MSTVTKIYYKWVILSSQNETAQIWLHPKANQARSWMPTGVHERQTGRPQLLESTYDLNKSRKNQELWEVYGRHPWDYLFKSAAAYTKLKFGWEIVCIVQSLTMINNKGCQHKDSWQTTFPCLIKCLQTNLNEINKIYTKTSQIKARLGSHPSGKSVWHQQDWNWRGKG